MRGFYQMSLCERDIFKKTDSVFLPTGKKKCAEESRQYIQKSVVRTNTMFFIEKLVKLKIDNPQQGNKKEVKNVKFLKCPKMANPV